MHHHHAHTIVYSNDLDHALDYTLDGDGDGCGCCGLYDGDGGAIAITRYVATGTGSGCGWGFGDGNGAEPGMSICDFVCGVVQP